MLLSLSIQDLVLIDCVTISPGEGFTALTGETGAGKSILLDALSLALGMRGDVGLIRQGAEQAIVIAEFSLDPSNKVLNLLEDHGLESSETLVIRRILAKTGRSRAFINDQMVSIGLLRQVGDALLEIHGQFDRLLEAVHHRSLLDDFADTDQDLRIVKNAYHAWQEAHQAWWQADSDFEKLRQEEDFLRHQLKELITLSPQEKEEETLLQERASMANFSKINEGAEEARRLLMQGGPMMTAFHQAQKSLQKIQGMDEERIRPLLEALDRADIELTEAYTSLEDITKNINFNPQRYSQIEERLYELRAMARKYRITVDELPTYLETLQERLDSLDRIADIKKELSKQAEISKESFLRAAGQLSQKRQTSSKILSARVAEELPGLMLPQARFQVIVEKLPESSWSENGIDHVEFQVSMNKGQPFTNLSKTASGGELARLMLALKVVLASNTTISTLIFDEIDIGVGGAVAAAIGDRLLSLSHHVQVLAITHSPQVASKAHHHWLVSKIQRKDLVQTVVAPLTPPQRREELARMLSGAEVTTEARAAADRLLS
jgi:DNA repair protein RecN (Recombination protein N)